MLGLNMLLQEQNSLKGKIEMVSRKRFENGMISHINGYRRKKIESVTF